MDHAKPTRVAVVGATGRFGHPLALHLASLGAEVLAVSRARSKGNGPKLAALKEAGCEIGFCADPHDERALLELFAGCETVVLVSLASPKTLLEIDPLYLHAAAKAGVRRFVPNEFGTHTLGLAEGISELFDAKKAMHAKILEAGLQATLIYPGLNADYCLPNLRFFHQVTTFGDLDLPVTTHHINDIGAIAARAILDPRTVGKAVQMYHNRLTQRDMLTMLRAFWLDHDFPVRHVCTESILHDMKHASDHVTAKVGVETDRERAQINYVCYITGDVTNIDHPDTLNASVLYPEYSWVTPRHMLRDPAFVFASSP